MLGARALVNSAELLRSGLTRRARRIS